MTMYGSSNIAQQYVPFALIFQSLNISLPKDFTAYHVSERFICTSLQVISEMTMKTQRLLFTKDSHMVIIINFRQTKSHDYVHILFFI